MASQMELASITTARGNQIIKITDADNNEQTVYGSAGAVTYVEIDNTANPSYAVWAKFYNNATPTVGTTVPEMIIKCPAGKKTRWLNGKGWDFGTAITCACLKAGGTGGTTGPDNAVDITVYVE